MDDRTSKVGGKSSLSEGPTKPRATFARLTFSSGQSIELASDDIVVLVGPNNAGKSAALRELRTMMAHSHPLTVLSGVELEKHGTYDDLLSQMRASGRMQVEHNGHARVTGYRYNVYEFQLRDWWAGNNLGDLITYFIWHLPTETRITSSNQVSSIDLLNNSPQEPMHLLYADDKMEQHLSDYFRRAYGEDLIVDKGAGSVIPLLVGNRPALGPDETPVSTSYIRRLRDAALPLSNQGDGMRSFATILLGLLANETSSVILLDEPEAFLHPPQARLLGEIISNERKTTRQLFIATHSADILQGLLSAAPDALRIIRLQRQGNTNNVSELDKGLASQIADDPLLRYSSVLSGVFHRHVIIGESDSDCLFYNSILQLPDVRGEVVPDVLFVHASGKHRMAQLSTMLRGLAVPTSVIADIDILNEEDAMKRTVESLGGEWALARPDWQAVKNAIEEQRPHLNSLEVKNEITKITSDAPDSGEFPRPKRRQIEALFRKASPWDAVKEAGFAAVPPGQPTKHLNSLLAYARTLGLWIVPVGQVEGFCRSVGGHGPGWVQAVLSSRQIANDEELEPARKFVRDIWEAARHA